MRPRGPGNQQSASAPALSANGQVQLPDGPGKQDFLTMCGRCHGVSTALVARRSPEGWRDVIQDMRARGAQGDDATANRVRDYLSRFFGPVQ
jgi:hypothetical protein